MVIEAHPPVVFDIRVRLDAQQNIVQFVLAGVRVVRVVRCDERRAGLAVQVHEPRIDHRQFRHPVVLHHLEVVVGEAFAVPRNGPLRLVHSPLRDVRGDLSAGAPRQKNEALAVLLQEVPVNPGLVVVALEVRLRDQLDEVPVSRLILGESRQVVPLLVVRCSVEPAPQRHVQFGPDDRLDAGSRRRLVEVDCPVQPAVVGDRQAVHPKLHAPVNQRFNTAEAVQHAVFGMRVQMREHVRCKPSGRSAERGRGRVVRGIIATAIPCPVKTRTIGEAPPNPSQKNGTIDPTAPPKIRFAFPLSPLCSP